jgi:hypothetical protein
VSLTDESPAGHEQDDPIIEPAGPPEEYPQSEHGVQDEEATEVDQ